MDRGIFVALSGAKLQEKRIEVLTNNLANVNTPGFKKQKPVFEDAMPQPDSVRDYSVMKDVSTDMGQGTEEKTGNPLDVAITGDGFFAIDTPNGVRYTRDGSFIAGVDGTLRTKDGHAVLGSKGPIKITSSDVTINQAGALTGPKGQVIDTLRLASFSNPSALVREGSYFAPPAGTKAAAAGSSTQVQQGYIEVSNVSAVRAMTTMIEALRSYETHSKVIQSIDDMTKKAIDEVGRV